ncbi:MAG: T9SS type A sorting domain-containing protein [Bacteroidota bacterium]
MKKVYLILLLLLTAFSSAELFAANYTWGGMSVTPNDVTGCAVTNYTFTQSTANNNNSKITLGNVITIVFPAGVNLTTATMAGSTFKGTAITAGWNITGQTLTFQAPVGVGKNASFNIVIANITNPNSMVAGTPTVTAVNQSGGTNSGNGYSITTTACPVVPTNDGCGTSTVVTPAAAGSAACTTINGTTFGASASTTAVCTGQADDDVWYRFTANTATHQVTVDGIAGFNAVVQVLSGTCAGTFTSLACVNATGGDGVETANLSGLTVGTQYFIRVYHNGVGAGVLAANSFTLCVTSAPPAAGCAGIGAGNLTAASLPYTSGAQTTCGAGDDVTTANATVCGSSLYYGGEDKVISFTPAGSGNVSINLTSSGSWMGMTLYQGCPVSGGTCVANAQSSLGNQSIGCAPVVAGQTYYLVVDSWPTPTCNPFNVTISAPTGGIPPGTTCANPVNITLPYLANNESTLCFGDDYTNSTAGVGTTSYMSGEDKVYKFVASGPDCISISITNANTSYVGFHVFSGCPGAGGTLIGRGEYATSGSLSGSVTLPAAGTYYILVDTYASPSNVNYNIAVSSLGTGPANDAICSAVGLTLGTAASGDNNCTGSAGEPASPACWSTGTMNTVWYSAVVPASGKLTIRVTAGSLTNPQIATYTGTCAAPVYNNCNDNVSGCSGFSSNDSQLALTGLAVGSTLWIRVDGYASATGTFSILAIDGNNAITPIPGQDCGDPNPVCQAVMSVSNPGYSGYGNICDLPTSYCLASGERNVVWYRVPVSAAGTLNFDIVPNDFVSASESETDYDFAIWEITDAGAVVATCAQIAAGTAAPDACNYSFLGVTGVGTGGNPPSSLPATVCPTCPGGYNPSATYAGAYEPTIGADAGDVYLVAVSNFISSSSGFRIRFTGTATIDFAASLASAGGVTWSGGDVSTPTIWTDVDNWGGCTAPDCTRDAYVAPFSNQPILVTGNTYTVKDVTIQAGATLTLQANSILEVCGNFYNYGTLTADPTSTIKFVGTAAAGQVIVGNLTGASKFGNLTVQKNAGSGTVTLNNDIEVGGTLTTLNATSILNSNGKYITLGKHFSNYGGYNTFTNTGTTGTLEFNGTGAQNYDESTGTADTLGLNFVIMNNTASAGSGVALTNCNMSIKATTGSLTMTLGTITTGAQQVRVFNRTPACVSTGNASSFVDGNLRRYLTTSGDYNWPVGNVSKGFQRARTNFSTTNIGFLDARFDNWPTATPYTQASAECTYTYNQPSEDNGYWTMKSYNGSGVLGGTGTYDCTLYPLNATNTTSMTSWTVIKRPSTTAIDNTGWVLNGTCVGGNTATQVARTGMTNFSFLAVDQALTTLPIELLSFTGQNEGLHNLLKWTTNAERDNDFFTLERSQNGFDFAFLAEVDGAGNSNSILDYHSYDFNPYPGVTYYRLKQTDFNGEFTYSNIVALTNELDKITVSEAYPNPTNGDVSMDFYSPVNGNIEIKLFDKTGRLILEESKTINSGNNPVNLGIESLAKGVYTLEIKFDKANFKNIQKLIRN